ncbi:MAG: glycosyltransferase [Deltaproteobacteria bacterium]|nr:glycosyltransferase [Deltaproteobacteria bacterium]
MSYKTPPLISVLMPVFNGEKYLDAAIRSVLRQSYSHFELIILNDGSTDGSAKIIQSFKDPRIIYIKNDQNLGLVKTPNLGIERARGQYIARIDSDDILFSDRFMKQVDFLESHPDAVACGSWYFTMKFLPNTLVKVPTRPEDIASELIFKNVMAHSSMMMRADSLRQYKIFYSDKYPFIEDWELWLRLSKVGRLYNIPEPLFLYRLHSQSVSFKNFDVQNQSIQKIIASSFESFGIDLSVEESQALYDLVNSDRNLQFDLLKKVESLLLKIKQRNEIQKVIATQSFEMTLARLWFRIVLKFSKRGLDTWKTYYQSPLRRQDIVSSFSLFVFFMLCFFKQRLRLHSIKQWMESWTSKAFYRALFEIVAVRK